MTSNTEAVVRELDGDAADAPSAAYGARIVEGTYNSPSGERSHRLGDGRMTTRIDAVAPALQDVPNNDQIERQPKKRANVIVLSETGLQGKGTRLRIEPQKEAEAFYRRVASKGKLDAGRTVRGGYAYDFDSTDPISPRDAKRASSVKAEIGDEPIRGIESRYAYRFVKRSFDIVFSAAVLVALSWLFLVIAIAVKVDDPKGPVFFKQLRCTKDNREFYMLKFRSMCVDAEDRLAELRELNEKSGPVFKIADDPRITRVGKWLRKLSLDELPQFINVLKGDMSVVGPRPALPAEVRTYTPYQRQRLLVTGGITCYWQSRLNRDSISFEEWVDLDLLYIKKCSVWTDFKIIVQTVGVVLTAQGS